MSMNRDVMLRRTGAPRLARAARRWLAMSGLALLVSGCSLDGLLGNEELPENVTDPAITKTPKGALRAYNGTVSQFRRAFNNFVVSSGRLTDELIFVSSVLGSTDPVDMRDLPESSENYGPYGDLNRLRGQAMQAIGLQKDYAPDSLQALTGHLYTLQAYAEIFLADLYCSGIPLSTLDYDGDFTYRPGSTSTQVYEHALALLDTASTFVGDSVRFKYLAQVGRARALLNLGRFAEAAAAVADVPDDFSYGVPYDSDTQQQRNSFALDVTGQWSSSVGDVEGINGLDYSSSGDPRTRTNTVPGPNASTVQFPAKYNTTGTSPIVLASGIEARLIEAEALLQAGDPTWLDRLNHLRQAMWPTIVPAVGGPLPVLADPGTPDARVDLLYRERAFWLFLTGQRQGDLRRMIRHYGRQQDRIYPIGPYMSTPGQWYGSHVDLPVWESERISNPHYDGCFSRS